LDPKRLFFDEMAADWDVRADAERLLRKLAEELPRFEVQVGEMVLDVGCGTGNLTGRLVDLVGPQGRVTAVDLSLEMLRRGRDKLQDGEIDWAECDGTWAPFPDGAFDRVFCYSAWPHFSDHPAVAAEMFRLLRGGGRMHIWHSIPRSRVNAIHRSAGPAVRADQLESAEDLSALLEANGFFVEETEDDERGFLVSALKAGESP
jgi:ubiquinone/menaquinone biosynthesis C-methylase UbiE